MSYISTGSDLSAPRFGNAWRAESGSIHATVYLNERAATLVFDSAQEARALIAECTKAAEALERLAAEGKEAGGERHLPHRPSEDRG